MALPPTQTINPQLEQMAALQQINANLHVLNQQQERLARQIQGQAGGALINVSVQNINMPFLSMVGLMVKWSLASIPAALIIMVLFGCAAFTLSLVLGGMGGILSLLNQ